MEENLDLTKAAETLQQMLSDEDGEATLKNLLSGFFDGAEENNEQSASESQDLNNKSGFDLSSLFSGISGNTENNSTSPLGIDLDMFLKIQKIMTALNSKDSDRSSDFLRSLKPFLKQERQKKLDSAIKIMSITKVLKALNDNGKGGI